MGSTFLSIGWKVLAVLAGLWLLLVLLAWVFQRQLIYLPDRSAPSPPALAGLEEVSFPTDDGLELSAWFVPADGEPAGTVVVSNGNAGNRANRVPLAEGLAARGYSVLLTDYRGYGGNEGSPDEDGLVTDARAAADYLLSRDDVDEDRLVYFGESVGSGVAAALAAERPPAALVLRSPFPGLADVGQANYPFLPVGLLLRDRFDTDARLASYGGPTLMIAGDNDSIVPTRLSRDLAEDHADEYVEISGAGHNDLALLAGEELLDAVDTFLRDVLPGPA
ncbi:alpha/beta fold hydrolase [Streptomyces sp. ACA25]|uniref:alpha/beta hydrolase n=1 Tax=Streptomyces sp. ACA25 TaxID=3022596 RepID=UPI002307653D|nr:alpha/beta fold hydrolase [Streptomyces sp. ACA25]MDB1087673.1 alpha/beta fold hydrolase [Streptomyces sp. ACA25]